MEEFLLTNIEHYGPWAVFLLLMLSGMGLPLGEDIIVIPAGVLISHGHLPLGTTFLAAYLGVVLSDILWFLICSSYGTPLLHKEWFKRLVHPRRILEAKHQIERRGIWVVVAARFIPASRTTTITVAGLLHLPVWKFIIATALCVCITAPLQLSIGFLIAMGIGTQEKVTLFRVIVGLIVASVVIAIGLNLWRQYRATHRRAPRAKARWLRRFRRRRNVPSE